MRFFLRHFLPISYFQATRLNRWALVGYNGLVEWVPALGLSYYYSNFRLSVLGTVLLSYLAFICVYEIGYITNDLFSERFEATPRGRAGKFPANSSVVWALIGVRLLFFGAFTYLLGAWDSELWWAFHGTLAVTFALHNLLPNEGRVPTFFGLSTYRYFAPMILTLSAPVLTVLLPTILLNNSLYRVTVYVRNKIAVSPGEPDTNAKFAFYLACFPLSVFLSVYFATYLPVLVCLYYLCVWAIYRAVSLFSTRKVRMDEN